MWTDLEIRLNGEVLVPDLSGALWWPSRRTLIVADMHLEKGSSFARLGQFLPPYDSRTTLGRLAGAAARRDAARIIALGDSFHDRQAAERLDGESRRLLADLAATRHFIWIAGNHDPDPPDWAPGTIAAEWREGGLTFRHEPSALFAPERFQEKCAAVFRPEPRHILGEVAGHLHPCARIAKWGRSVRRRCFAADGARMVLPAFGAFAGGLDVGEAAIASLFAGAFHAYMLGTERVYAIAREAARRRA